MSSAPFSSSTRLPGPHPLTLAVVLVWAWVLFALTVNTAQYGDHFEQFGWAQSFEWGYPKHPPLPSWLLTGANTLFGRQPFWPSVLSALCLTVTATFTWKQARALLGDQRAALVMLLWGLQQGFASKAQLFNHNSVLVAVSAATAWATWKAVEEAQQREGWTWRWLWVGVGAGAAALTKYQAAVPLMGLLAALALSGALKQRAVWTGVLAAAVVALSLFAPHLVWSANHHWSTMSYASQAGHSLSVSQRLHSLGVFSVLQLRMMGPALLLGLLSMLWSRRAATLPALSATTSVSPSVRRAWLIGLVGVPLAVLVITVMVGGMELQDHWGIQSLQYFFLALATLRRKDVLVRWKTWVGVALLIHGIWALSYVAPVWRQSERSDRVRLDQFYPARTLATQVRAEWQARTGCPLVAVRGPGFESGLVAIYSGPVARLVELNLAHSPWLNPADLARSGAMLVSLDGAPAWPEDVPEALRDNHQRGHIDFRVIGRPAKLHWAYVAPGAPCPAVAAPPASAPASH